MIHDFTKCKNIYIICGRTDMRKGIDGLATLIQDSFELDPYSNVSAKYPTPSNHFDVL